MRFYIVDRKPALHVVAEYVADLDEANDTFTVRGHPVLGHAGTDSMSEAQLEAIEDGRRALMAWRAGDDGTYEQAQREAVEQAGIDEEAFEALTEDEQEALLRLDWRSFGMSEAEIDEFLRERRGHR